MDFREKFRRKYFDMLLLFLLGLVCCAAVTAGGTRKPLVSATWLRMGTLEPDPTMQGDEAAPGGGATVTVGLIAGTSSGSCSAMPGLSAGQMRLCHLYRDHMVPVASGARQALSECKRQFANTRWNCSAIDETNVLGPIINIGSRESAFAHGLAAAGVTYAVARSCRDGQLTSCGCSRSGRPKELRQDWVWGGCGDNIQYGYKFTQGFIDVPEKERRYKRGSPRQGRMLMNLHNNEAGRRAVMKTSKVTCKCHGVSGSCSLITCWQQLPPFREVGDYIKGKFDGATEVRVNKRGRLQLRDPRFRLPTSNDLVYIEDSPNYCVANISVGSLGTQGRDCNRTSNDLDGCNILCCGRGYNTIKTTIRERCECKFRWCCEVQCKTCIKTIDVHTCK